MDLSKDLQTVVDSVRAQAVDAANAESAAILTAAKEKAAAMIADAKEQAETHVSNAEAAAKILELAGQDAVRRAARDARLTLAQEIRAMLDRVLRKRMTAALDVEFLQALVLELVSRWQPGGGATPELEVVLNTADLERLEAGYMDGFGDTTLTLKALPTLKAGLRISQTGEDFCFDFSDEALTGLLTRHLSRRFAMIIAETG